MIDEQSSAVTEFLKILKIVKKLQGNLVQISKQVTNTHQFKVTVPVEGQMVKPFKPKNNSVDASVHCQPHVEYQTSSPQSPYIQYDSLHEAMQACSKKQDVRANQRRKQRKPDLTCELRCQKSNESTVHLERRRRRLLRPEPWRAGSKTWRYSEFAVCTVTTDNPSEALH